MEFKTIDEKIILDAKKEVLQINKETESIVTKIIVEELQPLKENYKKIVRQENLKLEQELEKHFEKLKTELKDYERQTKQELIENIYLEIYQKISALEKTELTKWINKLVNEVDYESNMTFVVSKNNYDKYLNALSSKKDPQNMDLLSISNLSLRHDDMTFKEGFIIETKDYDLIFDFYQIVMTHMKESRLKVYKELFEDE